MGKVNRKIAIEQVMPLKSRCRKLEQEVKDLSGVIARLKWSYAKLQKEFNMKIRELKAQINSEDKTA